MDFFLAALVQGLAFSGLAMGIFLSLRIFRVPDITTDGSYATGAVITAVLLTAGWHPLAVLPVCLLGGAFCGWTTGYIYTKYNVNPLLSGILVMTALYSINLVLLGRPNLPVNTDRTVFTLLNSHANTEEITLFLVVVILIAVLYYILKTDFGIAMRATGGSDRMARSLGVDTGRMKRTGLALANALTAVSGYLIVQYQGFADINMGVGIVISGMAAVMIGESLSFGRVTMLKTLVTVCLGSVVFRCVIALSLSAGLDPGLLKLITALIVFAIIVISRNRKGIAV